MPLYEYTCCKCEAEFELLVRGDETPRCPACGSKRLDKHLSAPAAHTASRNQLPVCGPCSPERCDVPECGMGRCAFD
jgi:putative FmdB family regulatory protein